MAARLRPILLKVAPHVGKVIYNKTSTSIPLNIPKIINNGFIDVKLKDLFVGKSIKGGFGNFKIEHYFAPFKHLSCPKKIKLGKYLANGCSSAVFEINQPDLVAKQIFQYPFSIKQSLKNEINILRNLNHSNIIPYVKYCKEYIANDETFKEKCPDVQTHVKTDTVIQERMHGTLNLMLDKGILTDIDKLDIIIQCCEAFNYLNSKNVVHRDLKLNNIAYKDNKYSNCYANSPKYIIKLIDFDDAINLKDISKYHSIEHAVNPNAFPPTESCYPQPPVSPNFLVRLFEKLIEIISKKYSFIIVNDKKYPADLYRKSDIWAFGGIIYELFGASNPFYDKCIDRNKYTVADLPELEIEDASIKQLVNKLLKSILHPDVNQRFPACLIADIINCFKVKSSSALKELISIHLDDPTTLEEFYSKFTTVGMAYTGGRLLSQPGRLNYILNFINSNE